MFKSFRVAGMAAAVALLCSANSAAASDTNPPAPAVNAAAAAPAAPLAAAAPAANAEATAAIIPSKADSTLTPGRVRPDRGTGIGTAPVPATGQGVTATAAVRRSLDDMVAEHLRAETPDAEFDCLASAVYFESRGEPLEGQLAVAEVIINRMRSGRFRDTICNVVKQPSQFSFVRRGVIPEANRSSAAWQRAVAIAHIAMNNLHDVTGEDSLFFHATYVSPAWGRPARRIARIGNHIFYR